MSFFCVYLEYWDGNIQKSIKELDVIENEFEYMAKMTLKDGNEISNLFKGKMQILFNYLRLLTALILIPMFHNL